MVEPRTHGKVSQIERRMAAMLNDVWSMGGNPTHVFPAWWSTAYAPLKPVALAVKRANASLRHNARVARTSRAGTLERTHRW